MANILAGTATALAGLAQGTNLASGLTGIILASPQTTQGYQPQNTPQSNGFLSFFFSPPALLFHYEGEQTATLTSDITDHFIEDNTAVQDQISVKPVIITTHGFIGELNNVPPPALALLEQAANTLTTISAYTPGLTFNSQLLYDEAFAAYQVASNAVNAVVSTWSSLTGGSGASVIGSTGITAQASNQNKQQTYFQQFYGYWFNRTLFTIQTPWAIFQNMAIQNLRAIQSEETRMITDFEVTFKQINIASTSLVSQILGTQGRLTSQTAPLQATGTGALSPSITVGQGLKNMGA